MANWISVKDKLPPTNTGLKWITDKKRVEIGWHAGANVWSGLDGVTHWAEIEKPEVPK